jgi:CRISPR-associated protein Csb1
VLTFLVLNSTPSPSVFVILPLEEMLMRSKSRSVVCSLLPTRLAARRRVPRWAITRGSTARRRLQETPGRVSITGERHAKRGSRQNTVSGGCSSTSRECQLGSLAVGQDQGWCDDDEERGRTMLDVLRAALNGAGRDEARGAAALRLRVRLQPSAGLGARVMPPTYSGANNTVVYLTEQRRIEDATVDCVVIDGQASQSNRLEEALVALVADGRVAIPDVVVDQAEFGRHSALEFSHRIFDAWVEDALDGERRFGDTETFGRLASVINRGVARPLIELFPVGLLLGCWASRRQNPQGSTRLARAVTSEIIGYDLLRGVRAKSKLDIQHVSKEVLLAESETTDAARFEVLDGDGKAQKGKRPSEFGYGNVPPSAAEHGGVTVRFAEQQTVVSLAALRAIRNAEFGTAERSSAENDLVVRELLALLALAMLEAQTELGWDLRSGCQLVPETEPMVELVGRLGTTLASAPLVGLGAVEALAERTRAAADQGIAWNVAPIALVASPQQLELLRRSVGRAADESGEA